MVIHKKLVFSFLPIGLVSGVGVAIITGILPNPFEDRIVKVCEAAIKDRLRSPSAYQRVKLSRYDEALDWEKTLGYLRADSESEAFIKLQKLNFDEGMDKPTVFKLYFEYDAPNAFGTPIRSVSECSYFSANGSDKYVSEYSVKIDGKTETELLLDQVKQQRP